MKDNNYQDIDKFWQGAEKLLDNHYKKRRMMWLLAFVIPALIAGLSLYINHDNTEKIIPSELAENSSNTSGNSIANISVGENATVSQNSNNSQANTIANNSEVSKNQATNTNTLEANANNNSNVLNVKPKSASINNSNFHSNNNSSIISTSSVNSPKPQSGVGTETALAVTAANSSVDNSVVIEEGSSNSDVQSTEIKNDFIFSLVPFNADVDFTSPVSDASEKTWPKKVQAVHTCNVSWLLNAYGSANYVNKTLSASSDVENYLQHRKNEEKPVVLPSFGVSITASQNAWSASLGIEYSVYGEKTEYYPYSLQESIVNNNHWDYYMLNYVDTDTAYVYGNQYFSHINRTRPDSNYVSESDTIEEYKYDQEIASKNGVNRFYYIEVPVEVSYIVSRGRAGIGFSAGVAPGWMVREEGHYLRSDGKGIESFSEIKTFRTFMMNARASVDLYYRIGAKTKLMLRPQYRMNLNSVFTDESGIKQKYYSTGVVFGISYMLN